MTPSPGVLLARFDAALQAAGDAWARLTTAAIENDGPALAGALRDLHDELARVEGFHGLISTFAVVPQPQGAHA